MGISNRDYLREDYPTGGNSSGWLSDTPTVRWIIVVTAVVFVLQLVLTTNQSVPGMPELQFRRSLIDAWFALDVPKVLNGEVWRLLTFAFLHDRSNLIHILMNMLVLWFFGCTLERMYGSRELMLFYLAGAIASGVAFVLLALMMNTSGIAVGASGAVMAVFMLYGMHYPRQTVIVWFIPVEIRWLIAFYVLYDLFPLVQSLGGEAVQTGVAHAAHLGGLLFGWLYYRGRWRFENSWDRLTGGMSLRWRRMTSGRSLKVYKPSTDEVSDIDAEVDRILAKIHDQGSESLTERERSLLAKASERYKRRS